MDDALEAMELVTEDDKLWFEDSPDRLLRLRYATDGDWDVSGDSDNNLVLVFCAVNGLRMRNSCRWHPGCGPEHLLEMDSDELLMPYLLQIIETQYDGRLQAGLRQMLTAALEKGRRLASLRELPPESATA